MPRHNHGNEQGRFGVSGPCGASKCLGNNGGSGINIGSDEPHNNIPPYKPVLYIIKMKDER